MAASAVLAAGLTLLVSTQLQQPPDGVGAGTVAYLDVARGAGPEQLPVVAVGPGSDWVTLVAYPAFDDYTALDIVLEAAVDGGWRDVWGTRTDPGGRDSVAVTLKAELLGDGVHRLRVVGVTDSTGPALETTIRFRVLRHEASDGVR